MPPQSAPPGARESLVRRAGVALVWAQLAKLLEVALSTAIGLIAIRALGPDGFGSFAFLTNLFLVLSAFIPFATAEAFGVIVPRFARRDERLFVLVLLAGLRLLVVLAVYAALAAAWVAVRDVFGMGAVTLDLFLLAGVYWLALDVMNTVAGFFLANLDSRPVALWRMVGLSLALAGMVAIALLGRTTVGSVFASVAVGNALGVAGLVLHLGRRSEGLAPIGRERVRGLWSMTASIWAGTMLASALSTQVDALLIGAVTSNPREVAFFAAALAVLGRAQLLFFAGWSASVMPTLGEALATRGRDGFVRAWEVAGKLFALVSLPVNGFAIVLGPPLVVLAFGDVYEPAGGLLAWLAVFGIAYTLVGGPLGASGLWVLGLQGQVLRVRVVGAAAHVALAVLLIARYQALGAVIASGVVLMGTGAIELGLLRRAAPVRPPATFTARVLAATAVAVAPAVAIRADDAPELVAASLVGIAVFVAALAVARPFTAPDLDALSRFSPRAERIAGRFAR